MGVKPRTQVFGHATIRPGIEKFCLQISGNYRGVGQFFDRRQARLNSAAVSRNNIRCEPANGKYKTRD
jgi:hypothetical protein